MRDLFKTFLDQDQIVDDPKRLNLYGKDWTKGYESNAGIALLPKSTAEVSKVIRSCIENKLAIVPSGGRTGLSAGAFATNGEVVVNLEKMNKITEIDSLGMTVKCQSGVITESLMQEVEKHKLQFAFDLAAKGSSQIGGNIATNAGGLRVVKYGNIRDLVVGIEVVTGTGQVLDLDFQLMKNNTGYDLKQLFIGSEGTLGIITQATLKLHTQAVDPQVMLVGFEEYGHLPKILNHINQTGLEKYAMEYLSEECLNLVIKNHKHISSPCEQECRHYLLVEFPSSLLDDYMEVFTHVLENGFAVDGAVATNQKEYHEIWQLRELISETISTYAYVKKNDISIPVKNTSNFLKKFSQEFLNNVPENIELFLFGHVGDGNFHVNYASKSPEDQNQFLKDITPLENILFALIKENKGSVSAEHGVGLLKKSILAQTQSELAINYMKSIKKIFDPHQILNPGKIFDI